MARRPEPPRPPPRPAPIEDRSIGSAELVVIGALLGGTVITLVITLVAFFVRRCT